MSRTRPRPRSQLRSPPARPRPANDNNPEITGTAEAGSTVRLYHDRRLHRRRGCDRHSRRVLSPGLTVAVADDTRRPSRQPPLTLRATSPAARALRSPTSRTRRRLRCRAPSPRAPSRLPTTTTRRSPAPRRPVRRSGVYTTADLYRRRRSNRHRGCLRKPGPDGRGRRRQLDDLQGDRHRRRRQRLWLLELLGHLRRGLDGAGAARFARLRRPVSPANDNNPEITRHCRGRLDGPRLHDRDLHGRCSRDRHRRRLRLARLDDRGRQRLDYDLQGHRHRRCRQRLRLLELLCHLRRGLDGAGAPSFARLQPALAGERQHTREITGTAEAGSTVRIYHDQRLLRRARLRPARPPPSRAPA